MNVYIIESGRALIATTDRVASRGMAWQRSKNSNKPKTNQFNEMVCLQEEEPNPRQ